MHSNRGIKKPVQPPFDILVGYRNQFARTFSFYLCQATRGRTTTAGLLSVIVLCWTSGLNRIEKTVFISYRRHSVAWAIAVWQNLTQHGYDVFIDYSGIASGDFELAILGNIEARAHFLVLLTPSALDNCSEPGDWLRREIEHAISVRRNIVPLMLDDFKFGTPEVKKQLTGNLAPLSRYNGLEIYPQYFTEAMGKLREQRLNVALDAVTHPPAPAVQEAAREQQVAARAAPPIRETELTAEALFQQINKPIEFERDAQAVSWFRKAAETGNPYGMAGLGFMYREGRGGLPHEDVQAVNWFRKAAEGGAARGMAGLGFMYETRPRRLTKGRGTGSQLVSQSRRCRGCDWYE